ncbi:MAG: hypothetical protein ACKVP5_00670 [Aestuariivirga sp.]
MNLKKAALGTAFVALGLLLAAPTSWAGPDKNGGGDHGGGGGHGGGNGGHGGGHGGGDGGHGKNGGGNGGGHSKNGGGGGGTPPDRMGGGNSGPDTQKVVCVIGNQIVYVRRTRDCLRERYAGDYDIQPRVERRVRRVKAPRRVVVRQTEELYVYAQPRVRYVAQPSLAAMQQAERRSRRAQRRAAYGYADDGYGLGGGYAYDDGYGYGSVTVVERPVKRKKRHHKRRRMMVPAYTYDQGAVIHYGPTVTKGGAYFD